MEMSHVEKYLRSLLPKFVSKFYELCCFVVENMKISVIYMTLE